MVNSYDLLGVFLTSLGACSNLSGLLLLTRLRARMSLQDTGVCPQAGGSVRGSDSEVWKLCGRHKAMVMALVDKWSFGFTGRTLPSFGG